MLAAVMLAAPAAAEQENRGEAHPAEQVVRELTRAIDLFDLPAFVGSFHDDVTMIYPIDGIPRRVDGLDALAATQERVFATLGERFRADGVLEGPYFDLRPENVVVQTVGDGAAVVTWHVDRGSHLGRRTAVVEERDGEWKIVSYHASNVPTTEAEEAAPPPLEVDTPLAFLTPFIGSWAADPESDFVKEHPERAGFVAFRFEWAHPTGKLLRFYEGLPDGDVDRRILDNLVTYDPRSGEVVAIGFQLRDDFLYRSTFRPAENGYVREYEVTYPADQEFRDPADGERGWIRYRDRCRLEAADRLHCVTEQQKGDAWQPWGDPAGFTMVRVEGEQR